MRSRGGYSFHIKLSQEVSSARAPLRRRSALSSVFSVSYKVMGPGIWLLALIPLLVQINWPADIFFFFFFYIYIYIFLQPVLYNILHPNGLSSNLNESAASTATKRRLWEHRPRFCTTLLDRCFRLDPCTLAECWLQEVQCSSSPAHT